MAYENQSNSLKAVQLTSKELETNIRDYLGWTKGRVVYYESLNGNTKYDLDVDACYPSVNSPETFVSVTYCNPDTPGHSNENKLQLKLGELLLLKSKFPNIKAVLAIGVTKEAWLKYVLQAFQYFYDDVLFTWDPDFHKKLDLIKSNPSSVKLKHEGTWNQLAYEWEKCTLFNSTPVDSYLRIRSYEYMLSHGCEGNLPSDISNEIIRKCMQAAYNCSIETRSRSGHEWTNYRKEQWSRLWQSRSFFNPAEATIELLLNHAGYPHQGNVAKDATVPSLIHYLGGKNVDNTKVSEDFILFSNKLNLPVFIQSKSSGGGMERHGKNIQNRSKEQLARGLFYRGMIVDNEIVLRDKDFYWISILDGNWGVTKKTPLKYIHMLQWAGYDFIIGADSLVDENLNILYENNLLLNKLKELDCEIDPDLFIQKWEHWYKDKK